MDPVWRRLCLAVLLAFIWTSTSTGRVDGAGLPSRSTDDDGGVADRYHVFAKNQAGVSRAQDEAQFPYIDWNQRAQEDLQKTLNYHRNWNAAKNVILFIGDGMGVSTLTAARYYKAQHVDNVRLEDGQLAWENFHNTGLIETYNSDHSTPDSAGTATAFLCGEKTSLGVIGVNQHVIQYNCSAEPDNRMESILDHSMAKGKWTGIVTTTRITHATPASAYAHSATRDWEASVNVSYNCPAESRDIAHQLIHDNKEIRVILGGGRRNFLPLGEPDPETGIPGQRTDGANLIQEWQTIKNSTLPQSQYKYVDKKSTFDDVDPTTVNYLLGLFHDSHMKYEADRQAEPVADEWREPSLAEMTEKAIRILQRSAKGYFLLVEGGRIDHAHHDNMAKHSLHDTVALSDAVQKAVEMTNEDDTLIVTTADHSHVFNIAGYPHISTDILGQVRESDGSTVMAEDGKPYLMLGYGNGLYGFQSHRTESNTGYNAVPRKDLANTTEAEYGEFTYKQDSAIPTYSETHGGEDVAVYARGPMSHLFVGQHDQSYIAHAMMYASCVGANLGMCEDPPYAPECPDPLISGAKSHTSLPMLLNAFMCSLLGILFTKQC